jgi:hypothetical protein
MIGLFSVFEVMKAQENYMNEFYDPGEYKLTWMLCCYFSYIAYLFYICIKHAYFTAPMKYDMVHRYVRYNGHGLIIRVTFMVKCVYMGFGSNGFVTKT